MSKTEYWYWSIFFHLISFFFLTTRYLLDIVIWEVDPFVFRNGVTNWRLFSISRSFRNDIICLSPSLIAFFQSVISSFIWWSSCWLKCMQNRVSCFKGFVSILLSKIQYLVQHIRLFSYENSVTWNVSIVYLFSWDYVLLWVLFVKYCWRFL